VHHVMDVYNAMAVNLMARVTPTLSVERVLGTECRIHVDLPKGFLFFVINLYFRRRKSNASREHQTRPTSK
jgi:hypothetical protein